MANQELFVSSPQAKILDETLVVAMQVYKRYLAKFRMITSSAIGNFLYLAVRISSRNLSLPGG